MNNSNVTLANQISHLLAWRASPKVVHAFLLHERRQGLASTPRRSSWPELTLIKAHNELCAAITAEENERRNG